MEVCLDSSTQNIYKELFHQVKRVQEYAECVVPDINDDIGTIASVQTAVFLKSKDVTAKGVIVGGEVTAALLYITESESSVSFLNLSRQFTVEYEVPDMDGNTMAHINLSVSNSEARILNPRKVSVTFEICAELSCYKQIAIKVDSLLPECSDACLHAKYESRDLYFANSVCEKTFTINEQYVFPAGKPSPARLVSEKVDFAVSDTQLIGTKAVLKGSATISVCYLSEEVNYPLTAEFSSPFSQIVDIGRESMDGCTAFISLSSAYFDISESISGEKMMDAEMHAVVQMVSRYKQKIRYVADLYSNLIPAECSFTTSEMKTVSEVKGLKMSAEARISVVEDCSDVLCVFPTVSQPVQQQSKISAAVTFDIIYRNKGGKLSSVRRLENFEGELESPASRSMGIRFADVYFRPDGAYIDAHISIEVLYQVSHSIEIEAVDAVTLDTECPNDMMRFPTVTLVRTENESLWELAKAYHSSVEKIAAMNDTESGVQGKMLLIPKSE